MNKLSKVLASAFGVMVITMGAAIAETTFTPLNFDDNTTITPASSRTVSTTTTKPKGTDMLDASQVTAGTKMQNSVIQIDNAQTELRNKLLDYRTKYAEVDARYNTTKAERKAAQKQVKYAEKKIKNLENAKKKINKNFQRNMNI